MGEHAGELGYEDAVRALRTALAAASAHARLFAWRARSGPTLVSARTWQELAEIEAVLAARLATALEHELGVEPWALAGRFSALWRGLWRGVQGEGALVRGLLGELRALPIERWRQSAPRLESAVWSLLAPRTQYLCNTLCLALGEPYPYPALLWHPRERRFSGPAS